MILLRAGVVTSIGLILVLGNFIPTMGDPTTCAQEGTNCFTLGGNISEPVLNGVQMIAANFTNNSPSPVLSIVVGVIHNSLGQTVEITSGTLTAVPGATGPVYLALTPLPPASYSVTVFAIGSNGVALSSSNSATLVSNFSLTNPPPFQRAQYLIPSWTPSSACSMTALNGTFLGGGVCFGANMAEAVIFNCGTAAAGPAGCATSVTSADPAYNYNVTIWYPDSAVTSPDANCELLPASGYSAPIQAWCASIGSTAFIVIQPAPPIA